MVRVRCMVHGMIVVHDVLPCIDTFHGWTIHKYTTGQAWKTEDRSRKTKLNERRCAMDTSENVLCKLCFVVPLFFMLAVVLPGTARADRLKEGDPAPDLTLKDQDGRDVTLSKVWDKSIVVLYFYPMDDTPGCTKQACFFRDMNQEFRNAGAEIIGVSVDDAVSHKKFAQKHNLPFTLLADPEKQAVERYGVKSKLFFGKARRVTFVIDRGGVIRKIYPDVDVSLHSREVLDFITTMQAHRSTAPRQ